MGIVRLALRCRGTGHARIAPCSTEPGIAMGLTIRRLPETGILAVHSSSVGGYFNGSMQRTALRPFRLSSWGLASLHGNRPVSHTGCSYAHARRRPSNHHRPCVWVESQCSLRRARIAVWLPHQHSPAQLLPLVALQILGAISNEGETVVLGLLSRTIPERRMQALEERRRNPQFKELRADSTLGRWRTRSGPEHWRVRPPAVGSAGWSETPASD